jgi:phage shock protein A
MGIFDNKETLQKIKNIEKKADKSVELYNSLNSQFSNFKQTIVEVQKRSPEYEKEAKQASRKTTEFRNKAYETLNEINLLFNDATSQKTNISNLAKELSGSIENVKSEYDDLLESNELIEEKKEELFSKIELTHSKIIEIDEVFGNHPDLESDLERLEEFFAKIQVIHDKSNLLLKSITLRKNEVDRIHNDIFGYDETDAETNEVTHINGLKDELEESYEGLDEKLDNLKSNVEKLETSSNANYQTFYEKSTESNSKLFNEWNDKYDELNKKIEGLLPNALTAGLSHAFSFKKDEEVESYDKHKKQFGFGIAGMICVSLISFFFSYKFIIDAVDIDIIINRAPRLVLAILPLYIPVLWLSISSSKKMNLSKRLIEEYSHKEVLSKTFEGLSRQIENINEEDISNELRISLLQNFLHMYSENPGKLISNYDTSDHPVMELLENSNRLENSIEKLNKIPGMGRLSNFLERKSTEKLNQTTDRIEKGLDRAIGVVDDNIQNN